MELLCGTTGSRDDKDPPLPLVDVRRFRTALHAVARSVGATMVPGAHSDPDIARNFVKEILRIDEDRVAVLLNCIHPLVVFTTEHELNGAPNFVDHAGLAESFADFPEYTVLTRDTLQQSVSPAMLTSLAPSEIEQCEYWKPTRLGDIILNYWD